MREKEKNLYVKTERELILCPMLFGLKTEPPLCHYSLWQELELKSKTDNERALEPYEVQAVALCM